MKTCTRCQRELPLTSFGRDVRNRGGGRSWCQECLAQKARERRAARRSALSEPEPGSETPAPLVKVTPEVTPESRVVKPKHEGDDELYQCSACDRWLLGALFARRKRFGRTSWCRECEAETEVSGKVFCIRCGESRNLSSFAFSSGKLSSYCRPCRFEVDEERAKRKAKEVLSRGSKICDRCGLDLPLSRFYLSDRSLDGRSASCVGCRTIEGPTEESRRLEVKIAETASRIEELARQKRKMNGEAFFSPGEREPRRKHRAGPTFLPPRWKSTAATVEDRFQELDKQRQDDQAMAWVFSFLGYDVGSDVS